MRDVHPNKKICDGCKTRRNRERNAENYRRKTASKRGARRLCEQCGRELPEDARAALRFCKNEECVRQRQRQRWSAWRGREEEAGRFREKINDYQRTYRERTGYTRDWELRKKYGITLPEWLAMVDAADGKCEICGDDKETLCVDHDHITGKIRGVLCRRCNRAVGQLGDTADHLKNALAYLIRSDPSAQEVIVDDYAERDPEILSRGDQRKLDLLLHEARRTWGHTVRYTIAEELITRAYREGKRSVA